ncbi:hypothetical protein NBRC13296_05400 [Paenibacillus chitinolyticus]|uniref:hypothetical protein n=1 Tax=Paenibacillus chitinolyticus TaxID=79263 RepID=UPI003556B395
MGTGRKLMLDVGVICEELGLRKDYIENVVKKNGGMKPGARGAEDEQGDGEKDEEDEDKKDADKQKERESGKEEWLKLGLEEGREQGLEQGLEEGWEQGMEQRREQGQMDFSALSDNEGLPSRSRFRFSFFMEGVGS